MHHLSQLFENIDGSEMRALLQSSSWRHQQKRQQWQRRYRCMVKSHRAAGINGMGGEIAYQHSSAYQRHGEKIKHGNNKSSSIKRKTESRKAK